MNSARTKAFLREQAKKKTKLISFYARQDQKKLAEAVERANKLFGAGIPYEKITLQSPEPMENT